MSYQKHSELENGAISHTHTIITFYDISENQTIEIQCQI